MITRASGKSKNSRLPSSMFASHAHLQRKCARGGTPGLSKLKVNEPGDIYEQEADRIADQVMSTPAHSTVSGAPPRIQRFSGQPSGQIDAAPASVEQALASPGRPLEPALRQDMEHHFGHDFSQVRVHSGAAAEQSVRDVNADAYTVRQNVVFRAGRFAPTTHVGRRLIAHELTHVVQQSDTNGVHPNPGNEKRAVSPVLPRASILQRSPQHPGEFNPPSASPIRDIMVAHSDDTELYFGGGDVCPTCHPSGEGSRAPSRNVKHEPVTEPKILEWAATNVWGDAIIGKRLSKQHLFSLLQRAEDATLNAIWESYRDQTLVRILPNLSEDLRHPAFIGSDEARNKWAVYVRLTWAKVNAKLNQRAVDWLIRDISGIPDAQIPRGATLVTEPAVFAQIAAEWESKRDKSTVTGAVRAAVDIAAGKTKPTAGSVIAGYGFGGGKMTMTVGDVWDYKRIVSVHRYHIIAHLYFEVVGHEGIYFQLSEDDLIRSQARIGKIAGDVYQATKYWDVLMTCIGKLFKGAATAGAMPGHLLIDAGAKAVDTVSLYIAAETKWKWGKDIPHTCLSSTCRQYERCLEDDATDGCKRDLIKQAFKDAASLALPIMPVGVQAVQCLGGECEACGATALVFAPIVAKGMGKLAPQLEEPMGRRPGPQASDPNIAKALEKPKAPKGIERRPATKGARITDPSLRKAIKAFANRINLISITPELIEAEAVELVEAAKDPAKVHHPKDARYDAEITTSHGSVTYKRERGPLSRWERCWNPCKDGAPVDPEVNKEVDAPLKESEGKAEPPKAAEAEKTPSKEPPSTSEPSKAPPLVSAGSPYSRLSDTELVKRVAERTLDTSITGVKARLVTRSGILRAKLRGVLLAEFGENALREHEFIVIGMSADKAGSFQLRSAGKVFAANDPVAAEIFAYRAVARTGKPGSAGGVLVVVERGAAKIPREVPIGDMPFVNQIILQGEDLDRLSRASDVVALPEGFFDE